MKRLIISVAAASVLLVGGSTAAVRLAGNGGSERPASSSLLTNPAAPRTGELDRLIAVFDARAATFGDSVNLRELGRLRLDRARASGTIDDYRAAVDALKRSLALSPGQRNTTALLASGSLALHRFEDALDLSGRLLAADGKDPDALLVAVDANLELGRVEPALRSLELLQAVLGDHPAVMVRRAEIAHLEGRQIEAVAMAAEARAAAAGLGLRGRDLAFYSLFESDLRLDAGLRDEALRLTDEALSFDPAWPEAHATRAGVLTSMGRHGEALAGYNTALALLPGDPGWLAARSDLFAALGMAESAQVDLDRAVEALRNEDTVLTGRTLSRIYSDRGIELEAALSLAREDFERRQDLLGRDTYAWALFRNGFLDEARTVINPVIDAGLQDAEARFHAGLILAAAGDHTEAQTQLEWLLATHPNFSPLLAPEAAAVLDALVP